MARTTVQLQAYDLCNCTIMAQIRTADDQSDSIIFIVMISNSNWTEWSTIQGAIGRVISNRPSAKREADLKLLARMLPELYDTKSNY